MNDSLNISIEHVQLFNGCPNPSREHDWTHMANLSIKANGDAEYHCYTCESRKRAREIVEARRATAEPYDLPCTD